MACRSGNGTSLPMTAAVCRRFLSSAGSRSIRAAKTAWTVAGTLHASKARVPGDRRPGSPTKTWLSTRVRTLSSRKNGFPSVRSISTRLSGSSVGYRPLAGPGAGPSALVGAKGSSRSWV